MKNKNINFLIVALLLLAVMSSIFIVFLIDAHEKFEQGIKVSADGVTESVLTVRNLKLNPTESKEYHINLVCEATGGYYIYFDYEEKTDGGMKNFVNVKVSCEGSTVYDGSLAELLDTDTVIQFHGILEADEPLVVTVVYEMPREVGNDAEKTFVGFDIHAKIVKS